jgi:endonuclease G
MARRRRRRSKRTTLLVLFFVVVVGSVSMWREVGSAWPGGPDASVGADERRGGEARRDESDGGANAALGMPTAASSTTPDDFLVRRPQYMLSYNRSLGIPNWVAWHLDAADLGPAERGTFAPDPSLPASWPRVRPSDYHGIGYERGHMCPSGDRTATPADNAATFLMTNVLPQASDVNQGPWLQLEDYCRDLARRGNELYVVCGGAPPFTPVARGKLAAPGFVWKVVVALPEGDGDVARIGAGTRMIAVLIPNRNGVDASWQAYRTSVATVETRTGYRFFGRLPAPVRAALRSARRAT